MKRVWIALTALVGLIVFGPVAVIVGLTLMLWMLGKAKASG
jgi:hypothetical protein